MLAKLIEPTLFAVSRHQREVALALHEARELVRQAKRELREAGEDLHLPSFEIGIGEAFVELLATAEQRCYLSDATRTLDAIHKGVQTLHVVALLESLAIEATQGEIADKTGTDRGNFNRRIRQLVDLGLLESKRSGRKVHHYATSKGLDVLDQLRPGWKALHPESMALLPTAAAATLAAEVIQQSIRNDLGEASKFPANFRGFDHVEQVGQILGVAKHSAGKYRSSPARRVPASGGSTVAWQVST